MKRLGLFLAVAVLLSVTFAPTNGVKASGASCTTLQDQTIEYSAGHYLAGQPIPLGFDSYGYNYGAHMFKGSYANAYLGAAGFPAYTGDDAAYLAANPTAQFTWMWPYRNVSLEMKWNDAWLSDRDCDGDGKLDRHLGFATYVGSGAWITNHMSADPGPDHWTYFTKIVAAPAGATIVGSDWKTANGILIGPVIWNEFATLLEVNSGSGAAFVSPAAPGFGRY